MSEFELKFQVPSGRLPALEAALRRAPVQQQRLRARYFDTPQRALAGCRLVLRLRQEGPHWVQAAKGPGSQGFERQEHEAVVEGDAEAPDIARHAGHPLGPLLRQALGEAEPALQIVFETDVQRLTRVVEAGATAVEIALDVGEVRAGGRSHPVQEVEFELKQGSAAAAVELAQRWCQTHGLWLDPLSKAELGWRLAAGDLPAPALPARPARAEALSPSQRLDGALQQVLGNARELAAGAGGEAHVHQLREGLRALDAVLRGLRPPGAPAIATAPALEAMVGLLEPAQPDLPAVGAAIRAPGFQAALLRLLTLVQELR